MRNEKLKKSGRPKIGRRQSWKRMRKNDEEEHGNRVEAKSQAKVREIEKRRKNKGRKGKLTMTISKLAKLLKRRGLYIRIGTRKRNMLTKSTMI